MSDTDTKSAAPSIAEEVAPFSSSTLDTKPTIVHADASTEGVHGSHSWMFYSCDGERNTLELDSEGIKIARHILKNAQLKQSACPHELSADDVYYILRNGVYITLGEEEATRSLEDAAIVFEASTYCKISDDRSLMRLEAMSSRMSVIAKTLTSNSLYPPEVTNLQVGILRHGLFGLTSEGAMFAQVKTATVDMLAEIEAELDREQQPVADI